MMNEESETPRRLSACSPLVTSPGAPVDGGCPPSLFHQKWRNAGSLTPRPMGHKTTSLQV